MSSEAPAYPAIDIYANNQLIALYNPATPKGKFEPNMVGPVSIITAIQNNDGGDDDSVAAGKEQADIFLSTGRITQIEYDNITKDIKASGTGTPPIDNFLTGTDAPTVEGADFSYGTVLTPSGTTLGDMIYNVTFPRTIAQLSQGSLAPAQLVANLANLAINIVEPVKAQYPKAFLTNSFRHSDKGQHGTGQACDMQFRVHSSTYYDIAVWMSRNLPYDQLLLEYMPNKTVWIHVSYATPGLPNGGKSVTSSKPINRLGTLNGASGGKFAVNLHADIIENANVNRIV